MSRQNGPVPLQDKGFWTVPNMVTIGRPILLYPILHKLLATISHPIWWLYCLGGFIIALDALDGWIAVHYNQRSRIGMMLDPTADKVVNNFILISMTSLLSSRVALGFVIALSTIIFVRLVEDVISTRLYYLEWRANTIKGANNAGKAKGWSELIGVALAYLWLAKQWPGGAAVSAGLILAGCATATVLAFKSLRLKLANRRMS